MAKVIAVQEEQLNKLYETYNKNTSDSTASLNNAKMISESVNVNQSPQANNFIDMESQVVNLNSQQNFNDSNVVSEVVTNEVFGSEVATPTLNINNFPSQIDFNEGVNNNPLNSVNAFNNVVDVPYKEPIDVAVNSEKKSLFNENNYVELLNSLRNMITEFANNAYAAIDKFQENSLQEGSTGVNLLNNVPVLQSSTNLPPEVTEDLANSDNFIPTPNIFDNSSNNDLDKTVVLPGDFLTNLNPLNEINSSNEA